MLPFPQRSLMTGADLSAARQLWAETGGVELAESDSVAESAGYLSRTPGISFVASVCEQLVGAVLAGHEGRRGLLCHLAVTREQRGKGLGQKLVKYSTAELKGAGVVRGLILDSRDDGKSDKFWTKHGWEPLTFAQPMGLDL